MKTMNLCTKKTAIVSVIGAALLCGAVRAEEPVGEAKPVELEEEETAFVSGEFSLAFDSKYLSYGWVDNNEPILTPGAYLTFFDWVTVGAEALFDVTHYGSKAGYTGRAFQCNEFHPNISIGHSFSPEDFEWLPTTVEFDLNYDYEYHPRVKGREDKTWAEDTQFWTLTTSLPDLWLEPCFIYERDTMRDDGTYLNLELGHTFALIDGEGEDDDPVLALRPSVAQGFGNKQRVGGYLFHDDEDETPLRKAGLLDTFVKLELTWTINENLSLAAYAGYSDFIFDRQIREASRRYEATGDWDHSWNFVGGCSVCASF